MIVLLKVKDIISKGMVLYIMVVVIKDYDISKMDDSMIIILIIMRMRMPPLLLSPVCKSLRTMQPTLY